MKAPQPGEAHGEVRAVVELAVVADVTHGAGKADRGRSLQERLVASDPPLPRRLHRRLDKVLRIERKDDVRFSSSCQQPLRKQNIGARRSCPIANPDPRLVEQIVDCAD